MCACSSGGERPEQDVTWVFFSAWSAWAISRAECPGTCRSMEEVVPGPQASGRRYVEGPGSSGSEALPLNPEYNSEGAQPWTRRKKGHSPGGL